MRARQLLLCAVLAAMCSATAFASQSQPVKSDQDVLIEIERGWNAALYRKDVAFIEHVLADEFVAIYEDGSLGDKKRELAFAADFDQQVESAVQEQFVVRTYGDTAVVWFRLHLTGMRQGQRVEQYLRFTDVFVERDGRWQCVSSQSTPARAS